VLLVRDLLGPLGTDPEDLPVPRAGEADALGDVQRESPPQPAEALPPRRRRRPDLDFEGMEIASSPGLHLDVHTAAAGTPAADALRLLASWAASQERLRTEQVTAAS
jgi:hypothetical protein